MWLCHTQVQIHTHHSGRKLYFITRPSISKLHNESFEKKDYIWICLLIFVLICLPANCAEEVEVGRRHKTNSLLYLEIQNSDAFFDPHTSPEKSFSVLFWGLHLSSENAEITVNQCPGWHLTNPQLFFWWGQSYNCLKLNTKLNIVLTWSWDQIFKGDQLHMWNSKVELGT